MITSEEMLKEVNEIENELHEYLVTYNKEYLFSKIKYYIAQQEELTTAVKRYFELKAKGIMSIEETNEHRELLKQINEMVGVE